MDGQKLPFYRISGEEALADLRSGPKGLSDAEAADRLRHIGDNRLETTPGTPIWWLALRQFKNLLVIILLVSGSLALYLRDLRTALILIFIALINTVIGFFQEYKAESLLASLQKLVVPQAKVLRHGKLEQIRSTCPVISFSWMRVIAFRPTPGC